MYEADLALNERVLILQVKLGSALQTECVVPEESLEWQARNRLRATGTHQNRTTGQIAEATATFAFPLFLQILRGSVTVTPLAHH